MRITGEKRAVNRGCDRSWEGQTEAVLPMLSHDPKRAVHGSKTVMSTLDIAGMRKDLAGLLWASIVMGKPVTNACAVR